MAGKTAVTGPIQPPKTLAFNLGDMKAEEVVEGVDGNHFAWVVEGEEPACDWLSGL